MVIHEMYGDVNRRAYSSEINDIGDGATSVRVALLESAYTPDMSAHEVWSDVSASEVAESGGYSSGGEEIDTKSLSHENLETTFNGDNVVWPNSTITAAYAVVYDDTPAEDSDKSLISLVDFEVEESFEEGDFTIEWHADGIVQIAANAS